MSFGIKYYSNFNYLLFNENFCMIINNFSNFSSLIFLEIYIRFKKNREIIYINLESLKEDFRDLLLVILLDNLSNNQINRIIM